MTLDDTIAVDLLIGGEWQRAQSGERIELINPATEESVGTAAQASRADTDAAIAAASDGLKVWSRTAPWDRAKVLRKAAVLLAERGEAVARRVVLECGKPIAQSRAEVASCVDYFDWFAGEAQRLYGEVLQGRTAEQKFMATKEPVGVVAAFTAWNFPISLQARKIAPALAAGCSVVCRPAEEGTGAVALMLQCLIEAGLPPGVVNMVSGAPQEISETVMDSEIVRKVSFTGSIPVGKWFIRRSADTVKRMSMELGGHAPVIIWDDVDAARIAALAAVGKFRNNGQVCVSPTRFFVHDGLKEAFIDAFIGATKAMKLGNGLDSSVDIGPLINARRLDAIKGIVEDTQSGGARLAAGGQRPAGINRGYFFEPTVFTDTPDSARGMIDEPFGPIAMLTSFDEFDDVIARANSLPQGLAAYVFTNSLKRAHMTADALKTGIVCVNTLQAATTEMPFGGVKHSGFGREGGSHSIQDYLDTKFINIVM
ncbi:MAG: NAD-dependent succinate-semialdehyde dehydrogenase [Alphaproteobacteria bacterium]|nr:NAD-dependent succinate-semialdehyde dehydrogenase [Alphaproteobacteria bacterium]